MVIILFCANVNDFRRTMWEKTSDSTKVRSNGKNTLVGCLVHWGVCIYVCI